MNEEEDNALFGVSKIFMEPQKPPTCFVIFGMTNHQSAEKAYVDLKRYGRIVDLSRSSEGAFFVRFEKENGLDKIDLGKDITVRPLHTLPKPEDKWTAWNWKDITPDCKDVFAFKSTIIKAVESSLSMAKVMDRNTVINHASKYAQDILGCPVKPFGPYTWKIVDQEGDIVYLYVQKFGLKEVNKLKESNIFLVQSWEKGALVADHVFTGMKCIFVSKNEITSSDAIRKYCEGSETVQWQLILLRKWWSFNFPPLSLGPGFFVLEWMMLMFLMHSKIIPPLQVIVEGGDIQPSTESKDPVRIFVEFLLFYLDHGLNANFDLLTGTFKVSKNSSKMSLNNILSSCTNIMGQISTDELLLLLHKFDSTIAHLIS